MAQIRIYPEHAVSQSPRATRPSLARNASGLPGIDERRPSPCRRNSQHVANRPHSVLDERRFENTISSMRNRGASRVDIPPTVEGVFPPQNSPTTIPELAVSPSSPAQTELAPPLNRGISVIPNTYAPNVVEGIKDVEEIRAALSPLDHSSAVSEDRLSWTAPSDVPDEDGDWRHVKPDVNGNVGKRFWPDELESDDAGDGDSGWETDSFGLVARIAHMAQGAAPAIQNSTRLQEIIQSLEDTRLVVGISDVSNASVQGSPSQRLLQPGEEARHYVEEDDLKLAAGPSEARFAKDGFCSCSRFSVLTQADFVLIAEAEKAAQRNIPFQRWSDARDLIQRIRKQPRHEPSLYYWLSTLTNFTSWLTLADRRKEKNRIDNTYFFTTFRYRVKIAILTLCSQRMERQQKAYANQLPDVEKQKTIHARIEKVLQKRDKMHNLKKRQAKIGWTAASSDVSEDSEPELELDETEDNHDVEQHDVHPSHESLPKNPNPTSPVVVEAQQPKQPEDITIPTAAPASTSAAAPSQAQALSAAQALASSGSPKDKPKHVNFVGFGGMKRAFTAPVGSMATKTTARARVTGAVSTWLNTDSPRMPLNLFSLVDKSKQASPAAANGITLDKVEERLTENSESSESLPSKASEMKADKAKPEPIRSVFIVIGWFPDDLHEPNEIYVRVDNVEHFLPDLKTHITALRGWRSVFSFKSVQGFGLYKCRTAHFAHAPRETNKDERVILAHFFDAANRSYSRAIERKEYSGIPEIKGSSILARLRQKYHRMRAERRDAHFLKRTDSRAWAEWVHTTMNGGMDCPFESQLSLKLILDWSQRRIAIAALIPLALSLGVGLWYMATNDGVEGTSAAWTISSYIVTAGAFIIALIAILTALKDGQTSSFPRERTVDLERGEGRGQKWK